jgi:hypothetical protein
MLRVRSVSSTVIRGTVLVWIEPPDEGAEANAECVVDAVQLAADGCKGFFEYVLPSGRLVLRKTAKSSVPPYPGLLTQIRALLGRGRKSRALEGNQSVTDPERAAAACDENTIGVVAVLGSTFTGEYLG